MIFTFDTISGLFYGKPSLKIKCALLLAACFCIGTFLFSTLAYTFAPSLETYDFLGGVVVGIIASAIKLSV